MFKKLWKAAEATVDPQGVRQSDLDVIRDKDTASIGGILNGNDVKTLTKTVSGHTDSFLSFLFGKTMNELAEVGDVASPNLQKMIYIFMRTVDHLYNQNEHGTLQFFVNKVFDEKTQIAIEGRIKAKNIMEKLIASKPDYDVAKDTFTIDFEGKKFSLDQNSYSLIQAEEKGLDDLADTDGASPDLDGMEKLQLDEAMAQSTAYGSTEEDGAAASLYTASAPIQQDLPPAYRASSEDLAAANDARAEEVAQLREIVRQKKLELELEQEAQELKAQLYELESGAAASEGAYVVLRVMQIIMKHKAPSFSGLPRRLRYSQ